MFTPCSPIGADFSSFKAFSDAETTRLERLTVNTTTASDLVIEETVCTNSHSKIPKPLRDNGLDTNIDIQWSYLPFH